MGLTVGEQKIEKKNYTITNKQLFKNQQGELCNHNCICKKK